MTQMMINGRHLGYVYGAVFGVRQGDTSPVFTDDDAYIIAAAVDVAFSTLTPREEKVMKMLYGLGASGKTHSLDEVGRHFAVTRKWIAEIESKALRKLRHPSRSRRMLSAINAVNDPEHAEELFLDNLKLIEVPEFVLRFPQIKSLSVMGNRLTSLPNFVSQLMNLNRIDLDYNQFAIVPSQLSHLRQLSTLSLSNNGLTELPDSISSLSNLVSLYLSNNHIASLPRSIGQLRHLRNLGLGNNFLSALPDSVGQLKNLRFLHLANNRLETLPDALRNLKSLEELYLHGNDRLGLPEEALGLPEHFASRERGPASASEILDYYFQSRSGARPLNEAKLILVGRGFAGKTSIVNRLVHDVFRSEKETKGIKITEWNININRTEDVRLNVWDFGGQEIMHATHRFFLTKRSLYLVVINGREGGEDSDAEYWLTLIESFGGDSPVIVILNKIKEHPFDLNRRALQQKYPAIREIIRTDCKDATGLTKLRKAIERETDRLENLRDSFPASWFVIKNKLAGTRKNYLLFDEYRKLCSRLGEKNPESQQSLASHLHRLGVALNYRDDAGLRDAHVLNPHWVTRGIYTILNAQRSKQQKGAIHLSDISKILSANTYPREMHRFLLELMKKFELCFSFPDDAGHYLIPELLDKQEPDETAAFRPEECLNFQYHYPVLLEGLLPRFIVRTHSLSEGLPRWRTGVIVEFEGCRALVKADVQDKKAFISVSGPLSSRRRLLAVIRSDFERIHHDIPNLNPTGMVSIPDHPAVAVPYEKLLALEAQGIDRFHEFADGKVFESSVDELLNGVDLDGARTLNSDAKLQQRRIGLFYSYSHKDERLRDDLEVHLKILERLGLIESWHDRRIHPGDEFERSIDDNLRRAEIILLLVSADFIASDYCWEKEMTLALERHKEGQAVVIPIILQACSWKKAPFGKLKSLPEDGKPVSRWKPKANAWNKVSEEIQKVVEDLRTKRTSQH